MKNTTQQTERKNHINAMNALLKIAEDEKRGFSDEEQTEFDSFESKIEKIDSEINLQTNKTTVTKIESPSMINTGRGSDYSLKKVIASAAGKGPLDGIELECDSAIRAAQPNRDIDGCAVPLAEAWLSPEDKAKFIAMNKASGVVTPANMLPLTGIDEHDELFTLINTAIGKQMLSGRLGARVITTNEQTVRIPRQDSMVTAAHAAIDADLGVSGDPTFSNQDMTPKLLGSISEMRLSAMLAQHPALGTVDYFASELRRALQNEIERVFVVGDNTTNADEPDGLEQLATVAVGNITVGGNTVSEIDAIAEELINYLQTEQTGASWLLPIEYINQTKTAASFTGSAQSIHAALGMPGGVVNNDPLISALNLTKTVNDYTSFHGDFSTLVHCLWEGVNITANPYETTVFKKGATLIRAYMMHDIAAIDPKRILKFNATVA